MHMKWQWATEVLNAGTQVYINSNVHLTKEWKGVYGKKKKRNGMRMKVGDGARNDDWKNVQWNRGAGVMKEDEREGYSKDVEGIREMQKQKNSNERKRKAKTQLEVIYYTSHTLCSLHFLLSAFAVLWLLLFHHVFFPCSAAKATPPPILDYSFSSFHLSSFPLIFIKIELCGWCHSLPCCIFIIWAVKTAFFPKQTIWHLSRCLSFLP